jgi:membrane protein YqaA with SNARE-associated domain
MKALVERLIAFGPLGLFLIAFLDGIGVPLPTGVDLTLVLLSAATPSRAYFYAGLTMLASVAGGMVLFEIARKGGEVLLAKHTTSRRGAAFRVWFHHYGLITVFIPAFLIVPMPLKVFVVCAGALGITRRAYFLTIVAARIPRYLGLAYLGSNYGNDAWPWLKSHAWHMGAVAAVLCLVIYLAIRFGPRNGAASAA